MKKTPGVYTLPAYAGWSNQQLTKNCGIVPYLFYKKFGFHAVMAGARVSESYPYLKYVDGMDVEFLPDEEFSTKIEYIKSCAEDMDLLILHGFYREYAEIVRCYKNLRPDGKIYMETDANYVSVDRSYWDDEDFRFMLSSSDVVGAPCRAMQRYLSKRWPCKIEYIPNGFYNFTGDDITPDFSKKENIILTVGRIGNYQKSNEILLEAFAAAADHMPGWTLRLAGEIEENFDDYIKNYFARFPDLLDRVIFTGRIDDKKILLDEYRRAKIFALTSIIEGGTPNVVAEALTAGCFIVTSAIDAAEDATDSGQCGEIFPIMDAKCLAEILFDLSRDEYRLSYGGRRAAQYARENFDFERIVEKLYYLLYGR